RPVKVPAVLDVVIGGEHARQRTVVRVVVEVDETASGDAVLLARVRLRGPVQPAVGHAILRGCHGRKRITTLGAAVKDGLAGSPHSAASCAQGEPMGIRPRSCYAARLRAGPLQGAS